MCSIFLEMIQKHKGKNPHSLRLIYQLFFFQHDFSSISLARRLEKLFSLRKSILSVIKLWKFKMGILVRVLDLRVAFFPIWVEDAGLKNLVLT